MPHIKQIKACFRQNHLLQLCLNKSSLEEFDKLKGTALFMSESDEKSVIVALICKVQWRPHNKSH